MAADVLVVDDEADIRELVAGILSDEGYAVRTANDSESALAAIKSRKPALLILDIWMQGGGMDGLELVEVLRRRAVRLPALLITTHPTAIVRSRAQAAGVDIVEKPLLAEALGEALNRVLSAPPPQH